MTQERDFRLANRAGRAWLLDADGRGIDVEAASQGHLPADPMGVLARWDDLLAWARDADPSAGEAVALEELGPCVPRPRAVFAIGLNYRDHAAEAGLEVPEQPMVFTKFPSCLVGPRDDVILFSDRVDWEAELVVVIGREADRVDEDRARDFVAGYCVGQDVSDRRLQFADRPPQFSLGKSRATFGPLGPAVVPLGALPDPDDLAITCDVAGERMQDSRTSQMIFGVPALVSWLSRHCRLSPGDVIFTGTPAGVGSVREPRRYLQPGDEIVTRIEGLGELRNRCVEPAA
ncbi:MAG: fumarylacetoacetate hydrolase family protein [Myxococcota bacterium]|nr:fumarylacetoacetate hydrolase family protein [Myxococcota bacterium]